MYFTGMAELLYGCRRALSVRIVAISVPETLVLDAGVISIHFTVVEVTTYSGSLTLRTAKQL